MEDFFRTLVCVTPTTCPGPALGTERLLTPEPVGLWNGYVTSVQSRKPSFMHLEFHLCPSLALVCTASVPALCCKGLAFFWSLGTVPFGEWCGD